MSSACSGTAPPSEAISRSGHAVSPINSVKGVSPPAIATKSTCCPVSLPGMISPSSVSEAVETAVTVESPMMSVTAFSNELAHPKLGTRFSDNSVKIASE